MQYSVVTGLAEIRVTDANYSVSDRIRETVITWINISRWTLCQIHHMTEGNYITKTGTILKACIGKLRLVIGKFS